MGFKGESSDVKSEKNLNDTQKKSAKKLEPVKPKSGRKRSDSSKKATTKKQNLKKEVPENITYDSPLIESPDLKK